jgi:hypothetical protein
MRKKILAIGYHVAIPVEKIPSIIRLQFDAPAERSEVAYMSLRWIILFALLGTACAQQNWTMLTSNLSMYSNETKYDSFGSPGLIKAKNGTLLSFYREGASHIGGRGTWQLRSSTNNGTSWTAYSGTSYCAAGDPAGCLFAGPGSTTIDVRQVAGGVMADGSIGVVILYYDASKDLGGGHFTVGYNCAWLEFSRSTDNGASWSAPQMLNTSSGSTCAYHSTNPTGSCFYGYSYGPAIVTPNGIAVVLLQFNTSGSFPGNNKLWLLWTHDNGQTWGVAPDSTHPGWTQTRLGVSQSLAETSTKSA